jgi:hypothetical protein
MKLRRDIQAAIEITSLLDEVLRTGNLMACTPLLDRREKALEIFSRSHDLASDGDRESCQSLLEDLVRADEDLQALGRHHLTEAFVDLHRSSRAPVDSQPLAACFDRKA